MSYESETLGIRVTVQPKFILARSDPDEGVFFFAYRIWLKNEGVDVARLLFRHWDIHDGVGEDCEVDGEGVIGVQPTLIPGDCHTYQSFCVLRSPAGYMEGYYTFERPDGSRFRVAIPRFGLQAPLLPPEDDEAPELLN
ncbi:MAG TPA: Co2+/Mg2+ efflux protein ApaG [Longimicrobiales bacterium]